MNEESEENKETKVTLKNVPVIPRGHHLFFKIKKLLQNNGVKLSRSSLGEFIINDPRYKGDPDYGIDDDLYSQIIAPLNKCDLWTGGYQDHLKKSSDAVRKRNERKKEGEESIGDGFKRQHPGRRDPYLKPAIQSIYNYIKKNSQKADNEIIHLILKILDTAEFMDYKKISKTKNLESRQNLKTKFYRRIYNILH